MIEWDSEINDNFNILQFYRKPLLEDEEGKSKKKSDKANRQSNSQNLLVNGNANVKSFHVRN